MICQECGKENPEGSLFCNSCGSKILNEQTNDIEANNEQEKEYRLNENALQYNKSNEKLNKVSKELEKNQTNKKIKLMSIIVLIILIASVVCGYKYYKNIEAQNKNIEIEKQIKSEINEADNLAQQEKYYDAFGKLELIKSNEKYKLHLSNNQDLNKQINSKQIEYDVKGHSGIIWKQIKDNKIDFDNTDLVYLIKKYPNDKETKKICSTVMENLKSIIEKENESNYEISNFLSYMAIAYPNEKNNIKSLFDENQVRKENKNDIISLDKNIHLLTASKQELDKEFNDKMNEALVGLPKEPMIGMSKADIKNSIWGEPQKINETTTAKGKHEQWIYSGNKYIYFDNDVVTGIQK